MVLLVSCRSFMVNSWGNENNLQTDGIVRSIDDLFNTQPPTTLDLLLRKPLIIAWNKPNHKQ